MSKQTGLLICSFLLLVILSACSSGEQTVSSEKSIDRGSNSGASVGTEMMDTKRIVETEQIVMKPERVYKVVIDPGHGGEDPGATAVNGHFEKEFTLSMSKAIADVLEQDPEIQVDLTRTDDTFISTHELYRPKLANELNADLFISIHGNTFDDSSVSGTESFYYHDESLAFAEVIHRHVAAATGFKDRGVKKASYFVLRETNMPATLLELGYLTNPGNQGQMWSSAFQQSVASAIHEGIREYLKLD
ncbi:N-acetylmuramoyl-L-alanine amidase [Paenibacillus sp. GCM10012306]|uniref:N-acetylmuramoyl-L-alanine amidase family protein n=1 Tax=Paenibacillus sp. GCM10012306 TaxID=3317342 RepID=UPI0036207338